MKGVMESRRPKNATLDDYKDVAEVKIPEITINHQDPKLSFRQKREILNEKYFSMYDTKSKIPKVGTTVECICGCGVKFKKGSLYHRYYLKCAQRLRVGT